MKFTLISVLVLATLTNACKSDANDSANSNKAAAEGKTGSEESARSVMSDDLHKALITDAGLTEAQAKEIVAAGNSSIGLKGGTLAEEATAFLSGVLGSLKNLKLNDLPLVVRTIGSSLTSSIFALAGEKKDFALGGVPNLNTPEVMNALKAVFGGALSRLPGADKISYIYELIQGMMKAVNSSGDKHSVAQFSDASGSLTSGLISLGGLGLTEAELPKFVGETTRGMLSGSGLVKDFPVANAPDMGKAVSDGVMKGLVGIPNFKLENLGAISKEATAGIVLGAGLIPSFDPKNVEGLARSVGAGLFSGAKNIPGFDPSHLSAIGSASIGALVEQATKLTGFDKNNLPALLKAAASSLMAAANAAVKLDSASALSLAKSTLEGLIAALKNLDLMNSIELLPRLVGGLKDGLKEGSVGVPGLDPTTIDSLPTGLLDLIK